MPQDVISNVEQKKGRRMLLFLIVLFALPLLVVMAMYQFDWRPGGSSHGELIAPPKPLRLAALHDGRGQPFPVDLWKNKWSLVVVGHGNCDAACQSQVHTLRQVHVSLNKEIDRVQRVLLITSEGNPDDLATLRKSYPDLMVLTGGDVEKITRQMDSSAQQPGTAGEVYLVDPLGNLIMRYPSGYDPKGLRNDLLRLLKYSWVG